MDFDIDTISIINCFLRYLKEQVFNVFYMNSDEGSLGSALQEIVHYLWFYLWNQKYRDSYEQ